MERKTQITLFWCESSETSSSSSSSLPQDMKGALVSNVNIELYNALHYHMANKRLLTKDLKNGRVVTSMYNDLGLYINHYSNGVSLFDNHPGVGVA